MGFLDNVQSSINRGMAGANRSANAMKLKSQLSDAMKRRQALAAQLGASLYDVTKGDPSFRSGREALYDGIAAIDVSRPRSSASRRRPMRPRSPRPTTRARSAALPWVPPTCSAPGAASPWRTSRPPLLPSRSRRLSPLPSRAARRAPTAAPRSTPATPSA